ncbi:MAG: hypothetical protein GX221_06255 [Candidatus Riflebacteria bacterium]|nr:hypothetical protein [Candidatus Riflebacteria bacterium]
MIHKRTALTLVELMVAASLAVLLIGAIMYYHYTGTETTRFAVSQSKIQNDSRIFLDKLEMQMMAAHSFAEIDSENKKFSLYMYTYARVPLDDILFDGRDARSLSPIESVQLGARHKVVKYTYSWVDSKVTVTREPGWLYFLKDPIEFVPDNSSAFDEQYAPYTGVVLSGVENFEIKGYIQKPNPDFVPGSLSAGVKPFLIEPVTVENSHEAVFIVLRLYSKIDEGGNKRDEELDLVTKFYSAPRLAEALYPGYFSTSDSDGDY